MPTAYALVLRPPRAKDSLSPVHLRLTSERQPTYWAVPDVALSAKHWNRGRHTGTAQLGAQNPPLRRYPQRNPAQAHALGAVAA